MNIKRLAFPFFLTQINLRFQCKLIKRKIKLPNYNYYYHRLFAFFTFFVFLIFRNLKFSFPNKL